MSSFPTRWRLPRPRQEPFQTMNTLPPLHPTEADFVAIRRQGGLYVDKTGLFRDLLKTSPSQRPMTSPPLANSHMLLARPRRFGKTLLINTLEAWFQGLPPSHRLNPEGHTTQLKGLPAGWTSPPWLWEGLDAAGWHGTHGWHPVIRLDMAMAAAPTPADTYNAMCEHMEDTENLWAGRGAPAETGWPVYGPASSPGLILKNLIRKLTRAYGRRPVVLVDNYDAPVAKHIGGGQNRVPAVNALSDVFTVLKDDENLIHGVFATGTTRYQRRHLFLTANNFIDISEHSAFGALCGFTEDEVDRSLAPYREALTELEPRLRDRDILADWRTLHHGYRFSKFPDAPRVYNPFTLTRGLADALASPDCRREAAEGIWPSAWNASVSPGIIARIAADPTEGRTSPTDAMREWSRPQHDDLMLDTGYVTWHGGDETPAYRHFPSQEVAKSWVGDIMGPGRTPSDRTANLIPDLKAALAAGDVKGTFCQRLESYLAHSLLNNPSHSLRSADTFRCLLQALLLQMGPPAQSEEPAPEIRSDHEIRFGNRSYVFEARYNLSLAETRKQLWYRRLGRAQPARDGDVVAVSLNLRCDQDRVVLECAAENADHLETEFGGPHS